MQGYLPIYKRPFRWLLDITQTTRQYPPNALIDLDDRAMALLKGESLLGIRSPHHDSIDYFAYYRSGHLIPPIHDKQLVVKTLDEMTTIEPSYEVLVKQKNPDVAHALIKAQSQLLKYMAARLEIKQLSAPARVAHALYLFAHYDSRSKIHQKYTEVSLTNLALIASCSPRAVQHTFVHLEQEGALSRSNGTIRFDAEKVQELIETFKN